MRRNRWTSIAGSSIVAAGLLLGAGAAEALPPRGAVVTRDAFGVPHVIALNYTALGAGIGHAFAEDNLCVLAEVLVTLDGERARWFGPTQANVASDIVQRWLNASGTVERLAATRPPVGPSRDAKELTRGFAAGYNRFLAERGVDGLPDASCRGKPWVRPITELDLWRRGYQFTLAAGTGQFIPAIAAAQPPGAAQAQAPAQTLDSVQRSLAAARVGSNALGLGRDAIRGQGTGMLLGNPHFPWAGPERFYQMRLTVPGRLDVRGAGLFGSPMVGIGYNDRVAFTHTVSTGTRFTLYRLALVPGEPTSYLVDGQARAMTRTEVVVPVPGPDGRLVQLRRVVYGTEHGPVVLLPDLGGWSTTTAYALRDANAGNLRAIDTILGESRARSVADLRRAHDRTQGLPFFTTTAADADGRAYFDDASVLQHLTDAQAAACLSTPLDRARFALAGVAVLDGSRTSCHPGTDRDAVEPGIFGPGSLPHLVRTDWVANSNDSAWLTNPAQPLAFPRILGPIGMQQNLRTRVGADMISRRLAGTDGYGRPGYALDSLTATTFGNRVHSGELGRDDLVAHCRANPRIPASDGVLVDVTAGCAALAGWDLKADLTSRGEVLWREFWARASRAPAGPWAVPFDPAQPLTTPRGLAAARVAPAFADAVRALAGAGLPPDVATGSVQRRASIPIHGCAGEEGCYNAIYTAGPLRPDGVYPDVAYGSSFIMAVEFTRHGVRASTILTYGQSQNPASPYFSDQTVLFSRKEWISRR